MREPSLDQYRYFLKEAIRQEIDFTATDESRKVPPPPLEKPFPADATRHDLPPVGQWAAGSISLRGGPWLWQRPWATARATATSTRSRWRWMNCPSCSGPPRGSGSGLARTRCSARRPSAGNRHPLETYLAVQRVSGLAPGMYRYLPLEHQLLYLFPEKQMPGKLIEAAAGQWFVGRAAAVFIWTTIPYRAEWRYGLAAHKGIALDAGHVCQNLYLACEAIGAGTCAVAAYHQELMDRLVQVDGQDEFVIYLAPVGKIP